LFFNKHTLKLENAVAIYSALAPSVALPPPSMGSSATAPALL